MHPDAEHGLQIQLATALRERDEAREQARAAQAAWAKAKFRALPEGAQDALDDVIARADVAESRIDVSERRRDTAEAALAAARRENEGLRTHLEKMIGWADLHVHEVEAIARESKLPTDAQRARAARAEYDFAEAALGAPGDGEEGKR